MNIQAMIDRLNEQQIDPDYLNDLLWMLLNEFGIHYDDDQRTRWRWSYKPHSNTCTCGSPNYGYGYAKCFDCGKLKDHLEDDSDMLFHECENCNMRCNCTDQPCSHCLENRF